MQSVNAELLKKSVAFTCTFRHWGNRRTGDMNQVQTDSDKSRLSISKRLIISPEFDEIISYQNEVYGFCVGKPVPRPSFLRNGLYLVGLAEVDRLESKLKEAKKKMANELVPAFCSAFEQQKEEARVALNGQFNDADYPPLDVLAGKFGVEWNWIAFTVPDNLPAELRATEQAKLEAQFKDAGEEIIQALRGGFQELIAHAVNRLKREPGEKAKTFKDATITNITDFIEAFSSRNLMGDAELERLVNQAKEILKGVNPEWLRQSINLRDKTTQAFTEIKTTLDKMITERPARKFDFGD